MRKRAGRKKSLTKKNPARRKKRKEISFLKKTRRGKKKIERENNLFLLKSQENPIIFPRQENGWEAWQTFNPGVILLENKIHFLYRAIGQDGISRFGYASSFDGFKIDERLSYPVYEHPIKDQFNYSRSPQFANLFFHCYCFASGGSLGGAEDPRIVRVNNEDRLYMTYTACDQGLRVALTSIKVDDFLRKKWHWAPPRLISSPGQVHKNWVIFPEKIKGKYAILHSISPEIAIDYRDNLEFQEGEYIYSYYNGQVSKKDSWECWLRGAGAPPLKTKKGWLLFYHAIEENDWGKYKVGAMLLDLDDPTKIIYRSPRPVLEPDEDYENNGFKKGVVYVSGAIIKDDYLLVYYGASDSYVSVAYTKLDEFLDALTQGEGFRVRGKILKKRRYDNY